MRTGRDWSDLPYDILSLICNRLDTRLDRPRIRAVCKSWRSSIPYMRPRSMSRICINPCLGFTIKESRTTLYRFESNSWEGEFLAEFREWQPRTKFIYSPSFVWIPKVLNLLDCRVSECQKTYKVNFTNRDFGKAVYSVKYSTLLLFIHGGRGLVFSRAGEDKLTQIAFDHIGQVDITLHDGNFYAIDSCGKIIVIDPLTMDITRKDSPHQQCGKKKSFAHSSDNLYVVDPYLCVPMYRLNESDGTWVSVKGKLDQVVIISDHFQLLLRAC